MMDYTVYSGEVQCCGGDVIRHIGADCERWTINY